MSYVSKNLLPGEKVVALGRVSWWTAFWPIIIGVILGIFTVIGVLVMVPAIFRILTTEIAITDRRVIFKTGFISRNILIRQYNRIDSLEMDQSVSGRLLKFGDLILSGAGKTMVLKDIAKPKDLLNTYYRVSSHEYFLSGE